MKVLQDLNGSFNEEIPSRNLREALSKSSRAQENNDNEIIGICNEYRKKNKKKITKDKKSMEEIEFTEDTFNEV